MVLLLASPDLNPIQNIWSIIKQYVYTNGCRFTSKDGLLVTIEAAATAVQHAAKKLTGSMTNRNFYVIHRNDVHVTK